MKTTSILFAFFLIANICFGQTQNSTSKQKNKIVLKVTNIQKEQDALVIDRVLSQCKNIYSSKTDFKMGTCEIIADKNITIEIINNYLLDSGYKMEMVSIKPMTKEEVNKELMINDNNGQQKK